MPKPRVAVGKGGESGSHLYGDRSLFLGSRGGVLGGCLMGEGLMMMVVSRWMDWVGWRFCDVFLLG